MPAPLRFWGGDFMVWLLQISLILAALIVLIGGPYFGARYVAVMRGSAALSNKTQNTSRRNTFGLRSEPRFYGLLAIFVAILPAFIVALVALGAYVPAAQDRVLGNLIEDRLSAPEYEGMSVEDLTKRVDQMAFCAEVSANWMESEGDLAKQPRCLRKDFNQGVAEALIAEKDRIQNRAVLLIGLTLLAGFAASFLVAAPALPAQRIQERTTQVLLFLCSLVAVATMAGLIWTLAYNSWGFIEFGRTYNYGGAELLPQWAERVYGTRVWEELSEGQQRWHWLRDFLSFEYDPGAPNSAEKPGHRFGVLGIFFGTFAIGILALLVALPLGLLSAIYLSQFAPKAIRDWVKPILEILAGIPTIVYGFFALITVGPYLASFFSLFGYEGGPRMALVAGGVMGLMLIPFISSTAEDALSAVPKGMKDGALAMGSTKTESIFRVQFFAALPGIVGGILLAVSRAIGETMIVVVAAAQAPTWITLNPLAPQTTATVVIAARFGGAEDTEGTGVTLMAYAIGLVLLALTLVLNMFAIFVVRKFRARYE